MSDHLRLHDDGGGPDGDVTRGLRGIYAAPQGDAYWRDLEARILSHLTSAPVTWSDELDRWARPALVAAAVVMLAAGVAVFRAYQVDRQGTYEAMLTPTTLPVETAVRPMLQGQREATFRYLMTNR
jgi:hypothetical protein